MTNNTANDFVDFVKNKEGGFKFFVQNSHPVTILEHPEFKNLDEDLKDIKDSLSLDLKAGVSDRFEVIGILKSEVDSIDTSIKQISNLKWHEDQLK